MSDKTEYLMSIVPDDLQKFIMNNLDKEPDELLDMCIAFLKEKGSDVKS